MSDTPNFGNTFSQISKHQSWKLERISRTTYPQDIVVKLNYLTADQTKAITGMMKSGSCYRCRIGKGRFWFAETVTEAIRLALENAPERKSKL